MPSRDNHDWPTTITSTLLAHTSGNDPKDVAWGSIRLVVDGTATFVGATGTTSICPLRITPCSDETGNIQLTANRVVNFTTLASILGMKKLSWPTTRSHSWKLSLNAGSAIGSARRLTMQKRHATDCTMSIQLLLDAEATKKIRIGLIHLKGKIMFPRQCNRRHLRHHGCTERQPIVNVELGLVIIERIVIFQSFQIRHFTCRKFNILAIDGKCNKYTYRAHVFFSCVLSVLVPTCCHNRSSSYNHLVTH